MTRWILALLFAVQPMVASAQSDGEFLPARLAPGPVLPVQSVSALSGGEVLLEVTLDSAGQVREISTLRGTASWVPPVLDAVERWQFSPAVDTAEDSPGPVESRILVAAVFRAPTLYDMARPGETTELVGRDAEEAPVPDAIVSPVFPPQALFGGVVLVEATVDSDGSVSDAILYGGARGFEAAALDAARAWHFQPAMYQGEAVSSYAYLVFGFSQPITTPVAGPSLP